jgi:hypothetical protein
MRIVGRRRTGYEERVDRGAAYWLFGQNVYEVEDTHVRFVLHRPELFGTTKDALRRTYRSHGEKIGFEGRARRQIIACAVASGWIRIRHYLRPRDYWSIHHNGTRESIRSVREFLCFAKSRCGMTADDVVRCSSSLESADTGA